MKTARRFVLSLIAAAGSLSAQTIEFVTVEWQRSVDQKTATTVVNAGATPYTFRANVSGKQGSAITGSTFSSVKLGLTTGSVGPSLTFQAGDDGEWQFQSSYADQAAALSAYPTSGGFTYAMNLYGASALNATGDTNVPFTAIPNLSSSILQAPIVTLSNGIWQGNGTFLVTSVSSNVVLTFNNLYSTTPNATDSFHYDVWLNNGAALTGGSTEGFINYNPTTSPASSAPAAIPTLTIAAGQLVDGNTYTLEVGYEQLMAGSSILSNTAFAVGLVGIRSKITIVTPLAAVPEPATYALLIGTAALGCIVLRRRQRTR